MADGSDVRGFVADGFEPVAEALAESAPAAGEDGVAVAVTIEGETVVDVQWGEVDDGPWQHDTLCCIYSCTKGIAALCVHILADRGLLDPDAPVVRYWPEFGAAGKESTLVRHLLNHSAGLLTFPRYWEVLGPRCEGLADHELMAKHLAAAPPSWDPGSACGYHALTFGWLVGELVRRIDGRSLGRFFAEEVAGPLDLDVHIGLPDVEHGRVAASRGPRLGTSDAEVAARAEAEDMAARGRELLQQGDITDVAALWLGAFFVPLDVLDLTEWIVGVMNDPAIRRAELPAGNGFATARGLAGMYAPLANDGRSNAGISLVSSESIERFRTAQPLPDGTSTGYALGYALYEEGFGGPGVEGRAFGHSGAGGNLALADPTHRLSYAYVKNRMVVDPEAAWAPLRSVYPLL